MYSPFFIGRDPGKVPTGATTEAVPLISAEAWPLPPWFVVKIPGEKGRSMTVRLELKVPCVRVSLTGVGTVTPKRGTWKLTWPGETKNRGIGFRPVTLSPITIEKPPRLNGRGGRAAATT